MYYDLDSVNMQAELGIVIGDRDYWSNSYGYDAVTTLLDHMFREKNLKRVYLHTLEWNARAQRCFEKSGFKPVKPVRRLSPRLHLDGSAAGRLVRESRRAAGRSLELSGHRGQSANCGARVGGLYRSTWPASDSASGNLIAPSYKARPTITPSTPVPASRRMCSNDVTPPEARTG